MLMTHSSLTTPAPHLPALYTPLSIRSRTFPNRLWVSPMCQYAAAEGVPGDWHLVHLGALTAGRAGLIMAEATAVTADGRITPRCTGIWNDRQAAGWARIVDFAHQQDSLIGLQLAHAGRKASTRVPWEPPGTVPVTQGGWKTVAPTALPYEPFAMPAELDHAGIHAIVQSFARAATRAEQAGFDAVEIHAAHGYLLHQFLSPISNRRTDEFGGSLHNRARVLLDVVEATRNALSPTLPLFVRLSATDWVRGGWTADQTEQLAPMLEERGVDLLDISSGGLDPGQDIPTGPGYQVPFASALKKRARIPIAAVGQLTNAAQFTDVISNGHADVVFVGRQFLRDRLLPITAASELGLRATGPEQYRAAF